MEAARFARYFDACGDFFATDLHGLSQTKENHTEGVNNMPEGRHLQH